MDGEDENGDFTDPTEPRVFDSVVSTLRKTYPRDKMQDISTSFCFICLLHLANERGLKLEVGESPGAEDEGKPEEGDNKVGDLWGLRVFFFFRSVQVIFRELIVIFLLGLPRSNRHPLSVREGRVITVGSMHLAYILRRIYMFSIVLFVSLSYRSLYFLVCFRLRTVL